MSSGLPSARKAENFFRRKNKERDTKNAQQRKHRSRAVSITITTTIIIIALALIGLGVFYYPQIFTVEAQISESEQLSPEQPITVKFNIPILPNNVSQKISLTPAVEGTVEWKNYNRELIFTPSTILKTNTAYTIALKDLRSFSGTKLPDSNYTFTTVSENLPNLTEISFDRDNTELINKDSKIYLTVENYDSSYEFRYQFTPTVYFTSELKDKKYVLSPTENLLPSTAYQLKTFRRYKSQSDGREGEWEANKNFTFNTYPPLQVSKYYPIHDSTNIARNQSISITFNQKYADFDSQSVKDSFRISPSATGTLDWTGTSTLMFTPTQEYEYETQYNISLEYPEDKSLRFSFTTVAETPPVPEPTSAAPDPKIKEGRYMEVVLGTQTIYAYENGQLVNSSLISGGVRHTPSPQGDFSIITKVPNKRYTGANTDGTTYDLPNTKWNMRFHGPYWLHSAYWHNNFGTPMSHGCINLPIDFAEWIYNWAQVGDPVSVHS